MLGLAAYEAGICECGFHESLHDPEGNVYQPETRVCTIMAGAERYARVLADADEAELKQHGDKAPAATRRASDGRRLFMRRLSDAEAAERRSSAKQGPRKRK